LKTVSLRFGLVFMHNKRIIKRIEFWVEFWRWRLEVWAARRRLKFDGEIFGGLEREKRALGRRIEVFEFLKGFAFPFLEDVVVLARHFGYFIHGGFRFEFPIVERFGFVVHGRITDVKDRLFGIRSVSSPFDGLVDEEVEHTTDKYTIIFI
jgi:hypothetical protein